MRAFGATREINTLDSGNHFGQIHFYLHPYFFSSGRCLQFGPAFHHSFQFTFLCAGTGTPLRRERALAGARPKRTVMLLPRWHARARLRRLFHCNTAANQFRNQTELRAGLGDAAHGFTGEIRHLDRIFLADHGGRRVAGTRLGAGIRAVGGTLRSYILESRLFLLRFGDPRRAASFCTTESSGSTALLFFLANSESDSTGTSCGTSR